MLARALTATAARPLIPSATAGGRQHGGRYVELQSKLKRKKAHLMFIYPLLLLSLRVAVETVFRNA
jgi:hypothetical protein